MNVKAKRNSIQKHLLSKEDRKQAEKRRLQARIDALTKKMSTFDEGEESARLDSRAVSPVKQSMSRLSLGTGKPNPFQMPKQAAADQGHK